MSVDRQLNSVLQLYQDLHDDAQTEQIYSSTASLLTRLSNPLNLTLLTSHLLTAPAIWERRQDDLRACHRILSIFNTASIHVRRNEIETENATNKTAIKSGGLRTEAWARAVAQGADDRSGRWQHVLVLSGMLMGLETASREGTGANGHYARQPAFTGRLRNGLEKAVVTAANLGLQSAEPRDPLPAMAVVMALNYVFPLLAASSRGKIHCHLLLPSAMRAALGEHGLNDGLFLGAIDAHVRQHHVQLSWPSTSPSFVHLAQLEQQPLVAGLGPLSRLLGYAVEHVKHAPAVLQAQDELVAFTGTLLQQWQSNKLSGVEVSEEAMFLDSQTLQTTWPFLWQLLKKILYGVTAILQSIVTRSLVDASLNHGDHAPAIAAKSLRILRNLYFISSHHGNSAFQVYTFTYLTSVDILVRHGDACVAFLREVLSPNHPSIPAHPLHRTLDLFYLNTAEHVPLAMPPEACDALVVQPARAYLTAGHTSTSCSPRMIELFEAAHSAVLSVLLCPHNAPITAGLAPSYADTLLASFPERISPRQFRLAFRTTVQMLSPPFPLSASHPDLAETLLEMVRARSSAAAGSRPLPAANDAAGPVSEQSTLVLTLIDTLPFLHLAILDEWMTLTAAAIHEVSDPVLRDVVQRRFWDVLVSGEMDVERATVAVAWWGTKGGREAVLSGRQGLAESSRL